MKRHWRALVVLALLGGAAVGAGFLLLAEPVPLVVALVAPGPVEESVTNTKDYHDFLFTPALHFQDQPPLIVRAHRALVVSLTFPLLESQTI